MRYTIQVVLYESDGDEDAHAIDSETYGEWEDRANGVYDAKQEAENQMLFIRRGLLRQP